MEVAEVLSLQFRNSMDESREEILDFLNPDCLNQWGIDTTTSFHYPYNTPAPAQCGGAHIRDILASFSYSERKRSNTMIYTVFGKYMTPHLAFILNDWVTFPGPHRNLRNKQTWKQTVVWSGRKTKTVNGVTAEMVIILQCGTRQK